MERRTTRLESEKKLLDEEFLSMCNEKDKKQRKREKKKRDDIRLVDLFLKEELISAQSMKNKHNNTYCNNTHKSSAGRVRCNTAETTLDTISEVGDEQKEEEASSMQHEEDDWIPREPLTMSDSATVLGCVIIGLFIEGDYPKKLYKNLFQCEALQQLFVDMGDDERSIVRKMIDGC